LENYFNKNAFCWFILYGYDYVVVVDDDGGGGNRLMEHFGKTSRNYPYYSPDN
jgi:hypothetical protein